MSSLIRSLMVRVGADLTDFKSSMATAATAMKNGFGNLDLTQTNEAIYGLNKSIKLSESEFKAATAGMDDWRKNADGLAARTTYLNDVLDDQRTVLDGLQRKLELTKEKYGEDSSKATDLKVAINNQTAVIKKNEAELTDVTQKLDNFGKESGEAATKGGLLGKIFAGGFLANIASNALSGLTSKLKEVALEALGLASDLTEVQNVVDTTFGDNAGIVNDWSKAAAKSYGIAELSAKKYNGTLGAMLKSAGITGTQLTKMSTTLVGVAGDFASFYNLDVEEAFDKIRQGISGETEGLKQLGINLSQTTLMNTEYAKSLDKTWSQMTDAEKAQARYNAILELGSDAIGDFSKTSDSYANKVKVLTLEFENLKTALGEKLLPVAEDVVDALTGIISGSDNLADITSELSNTKATEDLIDRYRTLSAEIKDNTLSSAELSQKTAELEDVKQKLIEASNGVITALDLENGTYDQQVDALASATASEKEYLVYKLKGQILANSGAAALDKETKATASYQEAQENMNAALQEINKAREAMARGEVWAVAPVGRNEGTTWQQVLDLYTQKFERYKNATTDANDALEENAKSTAEAEAAAKSLVENGLMTAEEIFDEFGITVSDTTDALSENSAEQGRVTAALESASAAADDLITKYNEAKDAAQNSIDGQVKLFSDLDTSAEVSISNIKKSLQSQIDYLTNYNSNLKKAIELGYDKDLLKQMADGSAASAATLAALADAAPKDVAEINAAFADVEKGKGDFSDTVADMQTDFASAMEGIQNAVDDGIEYLNKNGDMVEAGKNVFQGYIDGIKSKLPELRTAVSDMNDVVIKRTRAQMEIQSPSKVMKRLYAYVPEGAARGILEKLDLPAEAMRKMNASVQKAAMTDLDLPSINALMSQLPELTTPSMPQIGSTEMLSGKQQAIDLSGTLTVVCQNESGTVIGQSKTLVADLLRDARRYPTSRR